MMEWQNEALSIIINTFSVLDILLILQIFWGAAQCRRLWQYGITAGIFVVWNTGLDIWLADNELLYFTAIYLYIALTAAVLTKEQKWKPVLLTLPALLLYLQWDCVCGLLDILFHLGKYAYTWAETAATAYELLSDIVLFGILLYIMRKKDPDLRLTTEETLLLSVFCIFCPVLETVLQYLEEILHDFMYSMAWVSFVLILNFAVFYGIFHRKKARRYRALSENYRQQFNAEYSYFKKYKREQKNIAGFRHDWNNHLFVLTSMFEKGEYERAKDYLEALASKNKIAESGILTGNEIVDMILNAKQEKLSREKIAVTCSGGLEQLQFLEPVDCCILFSNLIDNAIEANCKCEADRYIAIQVCSAAGALVIAIENKMNGTPKQENARLVTTKKDGELHGIGTQNAFEIIKKYHGEYKIVTKKNNFGIRILFPAL